MKSNLLIALGVSLALSSCALSDSVNIDSLNPLAIPPLIDSRETDSISLHLQNGRHEFYPGIASETKGFNGDYLGPTIRLYEGEDTAITFLNQLDESTTVHGHGLHVSGEIDGGPQSKIEPNTAWNIVIPVRQQAGTSWYHPHLMGKTAHHAHAGLAGLYIIEDSNSLTLDLPKDYGINDIPLVVQDRTFFDGKMAGYAVSNQQTKDGLRENTLVVNGTIAPYQYVPQGWVRLRLLNGSNARFYRFYFTNQRKFYKIATEGGFLNTPVEMDAITMAPGERNEIMIDLSDGDNQALIAEFLPADPGDQGFFSKPNVKKMVVELIVDSQLTASGTLEPQLNNIAFFNRNEATNTRAISLDMEISRSQRNSTGMTMGINGQAMSMDVINERINKGEIEVWRVTGQRMPHPFHIHGASFQILQMNGKPVSEADKGWKDTVVVGNGVTEIIVRFDYIATDQNPYMYHCHMFEHEEAGMMGQFTVQ